MQICRKKYLMNKKIIIDDKKIKDEILSLKKNNNEFKFPKIFWSIRKNI